MEHISTYWHYYLLGVIALISIILLFRSEIYKNLVEKIKQRKRTVWIWVIEYITVYFLPILIFAIVFQLTEDELSNWDKLISLPNWMLIGIILFGESLKELIEYLWIAQGTFKENVKISLSIGLFGTCLCAVLLAILIFDQYHNGNNSHLTSKFYYFQVFLFFGASFYSFLMKILVADAIANTTNMPPKQNP